MVEQHGTDYHQLKELRERQRHLDTRQDEFSGKLAAVETKLSGELGEIRAMLSSALENQKGVFTRLNRPVGPVLIGIAAVVISLASTFGTVLILTVNPIQQNISEMKDHSEQVSFYFDERMNVVELGTATSKKDREWLEKMTERNNDQIDRIWIEMKRHHVMEQQPR